MTPGSGRPGALAARAKAVAFPARGDLRQLRFRENGRELVTLIPDDEVFGLAREIILQRIYAPLLERRSRLIVDAGAHVGLFTVVASQYGDTVVSLEPELTNFDVLGLNIHRNGLENVMALRAALWTEDGTLEFASSWHTTGGAVAAVGAGEATNGTLVPSRSLDSLIDEFGSIDVLKLDIEGAEDHAIAACTQLDRVGRIVAELHLHEPGDARRVIEPLEAAGFTVTLISASSLYEPGHIRAVIQNLDRLHGQWRLKAALVAFLAAPIEKPRRPPGSRDMPLLLAERTG